MRNFSILYPMLALAFWTMLVLALLPVARARATARGEIDVDDFRFGESARVPPQVSIPNRNFMNLLELPTLFYPACLLLHVTAGASTLAVAAAWAFVAMRIVHSLIHLSYNRVVHRLIAFSLANVALLVLWGAAAVHLLANAPSP